MPSGLSIGEFARLTHLSVRTLRRYHEAELLVPAHVDELTGYRYYNADQIPTAQVIHRLRDLDVPLATVRRILEAADPQGRSDLVAEHLHRLESELERTRAAVKSLRRLLAPDPAPVHVEVRPVPPTTVAAVEGDVDLDDVLGWYAGAMAELDATLRDPDGTPGGVYDNALFAAGHGHVLVYRPSQDPPNRGRVHPAVLPTVELAVATHVGDHDDIDVTYGEVGAWVVANALSVAGPVRESYLVGPRDTRDRSQWRTEIGWPVFSVTDLTAVTP
ncbi:MerR family transcriptional regulator [Brachybacterium sp. GCM10030267]|uniref:MerR family transcriptional regulator n=1 Tax=Brachybacterium sp. GCM10030267 TaxID=3273381 RepID=UPI003620E1D9